MSKEDQNKPELNLVRPRNFSVEGFRATAKDLFARVTNQAKAQSTELTNLKKPQAEIVCESKVALSELSGTETVFKLLRITPRKEEGVWLFDDPAVGLKAEPFVMGADAMIEALAIQAGVTDRQMAKGIGIYFAEQPFSVNEVPATKFERTRFESLSRAVDAGACGENGAWYRATIDGEMMEGWLCPATLKYFPVHPPTLFALAEVLSNDDGFGASVNPDDD